MMQELKISRLGSAFWMGVMVGVAMVALAALVLTVLSSR